MKNLNLFNTLLFCCLLLFNFPLILHAQQELNIEGLESKNLQELRLLRNEIFAKHGYVFKDQSLQYRFEKLDWYVPIDDNQSI